MLLVVHNVVVIDIGGKSCYFDGVMGTSCFEAVYKLKSIAKSSGSSCFSS